MAGQMNGETERDKTEDVCTKVTNYVTTVM